MANTTIVYALLGIVLCLFGFALYWGGIRPVSYTHLRAHET